MSKDWVADLEEMHVKFGVREAVAKLDDVKLQAFLAFRLSFLEEELEETREAGTAAEIVDGLVDLCVVAIGTLQAFGVDAHEAWHRVHEANMSKEAGHNSKRPNQFGLPDLVKPAGWTAPIHDDNVGLLARTMKGVSR